MHVNVIWKIFQRDGVKWRKNWRDGVMRGPAWGATFMKVGKVEKILAHFFCPPR